MKNYITCIVIIGMLVFSTSASALSWAYSFVVWDGKVYEVLKGEFLMQEQVGKQIGRVTTKPNDMTGNYYGNASNIYPIGTKYYAIKDVKSNEAIAIRVDDTYVKAVYVHDASFHILNILFSWKLWSVVVVLIGAIAIWRRRA